MPYTPDFIEGLQPNEIFVFGSNALGYHAGGAALTALQFGAISGQAEGRQGQTYAIPTDFGLQTQEDLQPYVDRFILYAHNHPELHFLVTRIGCGVAGYTDEMIAPYFREALTMPNVTLPRSFADELEGRSRHFDLDRFVRAQDAAYGSYQQALSEIRDGLKRSHWIWYIFPQNKGLGRSSQSEIYGLDGVEEARAYLEHPVLGPRLREITTAFLSLNKSAHRVLGFPDVLKVQSCMTIFDLVSPNDIFAQVLDKFYASVRCKQTLFLNFRREENQKNHKRVSRMVITRDYRILLTDYDNAEVSMEPLNKAVYLLFLQHPDGLAFKQLSDNREELTQIYQRLKLNGISERVQKSIDDITNPLSNSINEKCSRIRQAFIAVVGEELAPIYIIDGNPGEPKRIALSRTLVTWESDNGT